jgi:hypothetical protein
MSPRIEWIATHLSKQAEVTYQYQQTEVKKLGSGRSEESVKTELH